MATNTSALKTFAQETRKKLISLISTKMEFILTHDTAEIRGFEPQIAKLKSAIDSKGKELVVEEVAYTWFNRVMALRYMDANGYTDLKVVTPGMGQMRPEILQEAMSGHIDEDLYVKVDDNPKESVLYRRLLVAVCNQYGEIMPFLFEHICDYTEMLLPDDLLSDQSFVTDIRNGMTDDDCQNVEIMGWLYQFYITDRKDDAEKKKSKKGGLKSDEQAAATQLFTPHWVVRYMVENSLGRIWMTLHPESRLIDDMPYYIPSPEGQTDTIPEDIHSAQDIRFIDPCMGSGHILVYAFDLFCKMYEEEGYQTREIPALILQNNIYGMDIDHRCYQLASFALTMKGRTYHSRYLRKIVMPNVIALQNIDHDVIDASGSWVHKSLMWQFENIDTIGSLLKITPEECAAIRVEKGSLFAANQQMLKMQAEYLSRGYHCVVTNPPYLGKGLGDELKAYVTKQYPNSKADIMATFMERCYEMILDYGKYAMINMHSWMFLGSYEELRKSIIERQKIDSLLHLGPRTFDEISGEVVQNAAFVISKTNCNNEKGTLQHSDIEKKGTYFRLVDGNDSRNKERMYFDALYRLQHKVNGIDKDPIYFENVCQWDFEKIPGWVFVYWANDTIFNAYSNSILRSSFVGKEGVGTRDDNRFLRLYWEVSRNKIGIGEKWVLSDKAGNKNRWFGNIINVMNWENDGYEIKNFKDENGKLKSRPQNLNYLYKEAISWAKVSTSTKSFRYRPTGFAFNDAAPALFTKNGGDNTELMIALGILNSKVGSYFLGINGDPINTTVSDVEGVPYIHISPQEVNNLVQDNISISKHYWDSHETSWDFKRNPLYEHFLLCMEDDLQNVISPSTPLESLLKWDIPEAKHPLSTCMRNYIDMWETKFMRLHANEEELNRKFIEIYGLQDELTPDVPLEEITILQKGEISIEDNQIVWHNDVIIKQFISWMVGCFMGRYSADKPGLIIASQGQKVEDLDLPAMTLEIDDDGIIPVIQESDFFTDDMTQRIEAGMKSLFGEGNFYDNMKYIKACLGQDLRDYLYKDFYNDHMQMYSVKGAKRPIYWLFSSKMGDKKKKGYFKALVYMHRIESDTLSKLHADYVSPYLDKIEQQKREAEDDAVRDDLTQAQRNKANKLAAELADKVREVKEFATILAQMSTQRLTIDLDDGVKTNYPKYYPLVEPIKGLETKEE